MGSVYTLVGCLTRPAKSLLTPMRTSEVSSSPLTTIVIVSLILLSESDETGQAHTVKIRFTHQANHHPLFYFSTDIQLSSNSK